MQAHTGVSVDSTAADDSVSVIQNPLQPAPPAVLAVQRIVPVERIGFDGLLHRGHIVVHCDVVSDILEFFSLAHRLQFPVFSIIPISDKRFHFSDTLSCEMNNTSGFSYRANATDPTKLSYHALGLAFDVNPIQNPYIRYDDTLAEVERIPRKGTYEPQVAGTLTEYHPLVRLLESRGWVWGGRWTPESGRVDYQHFEKHVTVL